LKSLILAAAMAAPSPLLQLESGDTISIVGNTFAERMQHHPWFEAGLRAARPELDLHLRNFGWSGDEVAMQPRPLNFAGMQAHLERVGTDVVIACFGMNESFGGEEGLVAFRSDLAAWLDAHAGYRVILVSPIAHESLGERMPDGTSHTFDLGRYTQVMREEAASRGVAFIDLHWPTREAMGGRDDLTINGIHLNDAGYRLVAREMLVRSGIDPSGMESVTEPRLADIREKNRFAFERFRPINTEYVYGRRFEPFGVDNFPREMDRLERIALEADAALLAGERVDGERIIADMEPPWIPEVGEAGWDEVATAPEDRAVPAAAAQVNNFVLPDGWSINCFASEEDFPELANPIAMNFDGEGRLWVVVSPTYPHVQPGASPDDKLIVLEDTDRDGRADTLTVFADGLYIPTGFATNGDEAWVVSQPNLLHVADTDGDGVSDTREIVLHGFGPEDSHHAMSAFARPPGGSLYFQEGTFHHSQIESPAGPARSTDAAVYRFDPHTGDVEVASSWPWANPWGHVVDRWGRSIITDGTSATSRRLSHIAGAHQYPDDLKGDAAIRGVPSFTPANRRPGGGTEILGGAHVGSDAQGRLVIPQNIGYHGLHWYDLSEVDSGFAAEPIDPDFVYSRDPTCRPVDVEVGPDGAVYMLDWSNPIVGHMQFSVRDPRRDHTHGRVWRITRDDQPPNDWAQRKTLEIPALLEAIKGTDPWAVRRSRLELHRRPSDEVLPEAKAWASGSERDLLEVLWLHQAHGVVDPDLLDRVLASEDPRARAAGVAVLSAWRDDVDPLPRLQRAVLDADAGVRLEAILALGFVQDPRSVELLALAMRQPVDAGMRAVLTRSLHMLEPWGTPGGPGTEAWRLRKLDDAALLAAPLGFFSAAERLHRGSLDREVRMEAAAWLAAQSGRSVVAEVWDAARTMPTGGAADLLCSMDPEALGTIEDALSEAAADHASGAVRQLAWAAIAGMWGWDRAWEAAHEPRSTRSRVDLLEALAVWPQAGRDGADQAVAGMLAGGPMPERPTLRGGRVRVELEGSATLTLAEVEVFSGSENVALGRPCAQSTTNWDGVAGRAVDGDSTGAWAAGTSTHTREGAPAPWWEVDLGAAAPIDRIVVHNRTDRPYHKRLDGYRVRVLTETGEEVWLSERRPAPEYRDEIVVGGDADDPVLAAAMHALAAMSPTTETVAVLQKWVEGGRDHLRMEAVEAMDRIALDRWPASAVRYRPARIRIEAVPHKMVYDTTRFDVTAGQFVVIELVNADDMPHNLVVAKPGSLRRIGRAADAQGMDGDAAARGYVPDDAGILHATPLVLPGETGTVRFFAPDRPGRYPYICTYPAHWQMMNGVMGVKQSRVEKNP
jgi:putative membrane-bound dehydrogenase-like protein